MNDEQIKDWTEKELHQTSLCLHQHSKLAFCIKIIAIVFKENADSTDSKLLISLSSLEIGECLLTSFVVNTKRIMVKMA